MLSDLEGDMAPWDVDACTDVKAQRHRCSKYERIRNWLFDEGCKLLNVCWISVILKAEH